MYTTIPEADDDDEEAPERPSRALETAAQSAELFRIVHETILTYCGSRGKVTAQQMLKLYERYLGWKEDLPPDIALLDLEAKPLPHVLFLQYVFLLATLAKSKAPNPKAKPR